MNNKFIKRVAAVVLGVAVLSTCAFASAITEESYVNQDAELSFKYAAATAGDKVSLIANAATVNAEDSTKYDLGEIVAINQYDSAATTATAETLTIDASKLAGYTHIVIRSGDSAGNPVVEKVVEIADYVPVSEIKNSGTFEVTLGEGEDAVTYTNVPMFDVKVTIKKGSYKVTGFTATSDVTTTPRNLTIAKGGIPAINGDGVIEIGNVYVIGVPEAEISTLKIAPVVEANVAD